MMVAASEPTSGYQQDALAFCAGLDCPFKSKGAVCTHKLDVFSTHNACPTCLVAGDDSWTFASWARSAEIQPCLAKNSER
jgi:hypothetical protein